MSSLFSRSRKAPYIPNAISPPDISGVEEARRAALAFALGEANARPPRKPSRATLPDVDLAMGEPQSERPWLERLFGAPRALKSHRKPSSRAV